MVEVVKILMGSTVAKIIEYSDESRWVSIPHSGQTYRHTFVQSNSHLFMVTITVIIITILNMKETSELHDLYHVLTCFPGITMTTSF